jgi:hypothetical protein
MSWGSCQILWHFSLETVSYFCYKKSVERTTCVMSIGDVMEQWPGPHSPIWLFPFRPQDWAQTLPAVQASLRTVRDELGQLQDRVETLAARLKQHSTTAAQPPLSDFPSKTTRRRTASITSRKAGGKLGHRGHRQVLFAPPRVQELRPAWAACGGWALVEVPRWCQRTKAPPTGDAW